MAQVLDIDRSKSRKDRTFVGSECAVCEEPLELTLRGERILQLSCTHIAHEACFYEYLREFDSHLCPSCNAPLGLDSSRGVTMPSLDILSNAVRGPAPVKQREYAPSMMSNSQNWEPRNNTQSWEQRTMAEPQPMQSPAPLRAQSSQEVLLTRNRSITQNSERAATIGPLLHARNPSAATGQLPGSEYGDQSTLIGRKHDYDVQSMETSLGSPRAQVKNPIASPTVTVRSEYPTLTRSREQQSLTCLVTVEVGQPKWRPVPTDLTSLPPLPPGGSSDYGSLMSPPLAHRRNNSTQSETPEDLERITEELHNRVDNWHGLDFSRFGKLRLHGHIRVGKDRRAWQDLDCYLFSEMLICVKERKAAPNGQVELGSETLRRPKCTLKGSILIKKHLKEVETSADENILTLSLSVSELPAFYLQFRNRAHLNVWKRALLEINNPGLVSARSPEYELDNSGTDEDEYKTNPAKRLSSVNSSYGAAKSYNTAPTEYSNSRGMGYDPRLVQPIHVPLDVVVVIPVSSSMQGLKITLLRDALRFLVSSLGERDRMGLVTFGSSGGGVPVVGMTSKTWNGWGKALDSIRPAGQKSLRADVVEGANVAMDLLMQRKSANPIASILLISDSSTSDVESVDFVIQRAEAAKVVIHSFGLGLTHKPDTMIELSTRTKASYTYVKDWMMLREAAMADVSEEEKKWGRYWNCLAQES